MERVKFVFFLIRCHIIPVANYGPKYASKSQESPGAWDNITGGLKNSWDNTVYAIKHPVKSYNVRNWNLKIVNYFKLFFKFCQFYEQFSGFRACDRLYLSYRRLGWKKKSTKTTPNWSHISIEGDGARLIKLELWWKIYFCFFVLFIFVKNLLFCTLTDWMTLVSGHLCLRFVSEIILLNDFFFVNKDRYTHSIFFLMYVAATL